MVILVNGIALQAGAVDFNNWGRMSTPVWGRFE